MSNYTIEPPTQGRWDFENRTHKKKLIEIVSERDGTWCKRCGCTSGLGLHHLRSRGQAPKDLLLRDGEILFYRDDPYNLIFLCHFPNAINLGVPCHNWVHSNPQKASERKLLINPET